MSFRVLALESSCDEFAGAVIEDGIEVLASVVASQAEIHARYGGVVPEVAGREHLRNLAPVMQATLESAGLDWDDLDAIAVTQGPGLGGSLLVGVNAAKAAAWARGLPLIPVHHIAGHLYANWLRPARDEWDDAPPPFPLVALVVSGGHTGRCWRRARATHERDSQPRAAAAGEAFDNVVRLLGLPFPGGPEIERAAGRASPERIAALDPLPRAWLPGTHDFSFSGLKTAVLNRVRRAEAAGQEIDVPAMAARFQESVTDVLAEKTALAAESLGAACVVVAGGVAANSALREALRSRCAVPVRVPPPRLCTDNAAMIGAAACYRQTRAPLDIDVFSTSGAEVFSADS
ncbi:MAG: tRNA (adenosine(37)-N6)-threonylcarbamoyltransferase complex transferase subunit TsaD [Chloroflexi bacterium]|nr:tRNA (adenosine(37)-N6)-threonylcarbamoyltransferase complex transferase subunit TsaD [Chloroflexota bacterium]